MKQYFIIYFTKVTMKDYKDKCRKLALIIEKIQFSLVIKDLVKII